MTALAPGRNRTARPPAFWPHVELPAWVAAAGIAVGWWWLWNFDALTASTAVVATIVGLVLAMPFVVATVAPLAAVAVLQLIYFAANLHPDFLLYRGAAADGLDVVETEPWVGATTMAHTVVAAQVACFLVVRHRPLRPVVVALVLLAAPDAIISAVDARRDVPLDVLTSMLGVALTLCPAYVLALVLRHRAHRAARHRRTLADEAVRDERARIARELQSLVLVDLDRIATRAERAAGTDEPLPPGEAREALEGIAATGRDALGAMRRLLGMLRSTGGPGSVAEPQPTLNRLDELVATHRARGLSVELAVSGEPRTPSAQVDLAAYRIAQDVLRRARSESTVRLGVSYHHDAVRLTADGRFTTRGGAVLREWVGLVGGDVRQRRQGAPQLEVRLPDQRDGAAG